MIFSIYLQKLYLMSIHLQSCQGMEFDLDMLKKMSTDYAEVKKQAIKGTFFFGLERSKFSVFLYHFLM